MERRPCALPGSGALISSEGKTVSGDRSLIASITLEMMEFCSGQDFGINYSAYQPPQSSPDSDSVHTKPHPSPPFYQEPHSPENSSFSKSQILFRPASPLSHTPSPTIQPSSPSEDPYNKSSSPNRPTSYAYSKSSDVILGTIQGEPQHLLEACEPSEAEPLIKSIYSKSSSIEEPSYVYPKSLESGVQCQSPLDPGQSSVAYPHYLQEEAESYLHYQVGI